jgi:hypothetical protein
MFNCPILILLFLFSSCALFKSQPSLKKDSLDSALASIQVTGEGRGRLGVGPQNYLFSYEAVLKENTDWMLAVSVPLHGEEVMVLHEIKQKISPEQERESFELRIDHEIHQRLNLGKISGRDVTQELRKIIRFVIAEQLSLEKECESAVPGFYECKMEGESFLITLERDTINIKKNIRDTHYFELEGENLSNSSFQRTNFYLRSVQGKVKAPALMSLELFWK